MHLQFSQTRSLLVLIGNSTTIFLTALQKEYLLSSLHAFVTNTFYISSLQHAFVLLKILKFSWTANFKVGFDRYMLGITTMPYMNVAVPLENLSHCCGMVQNGCRGPGTLQIIFATFANAKISSALPGVLSRLSLAKNSWPLVNVDTVSSNSSCCIN